MYLELLVAERVLTVQSLELFLQQLAQNKLVNPISSNESNKRITLHREEFKKFLSSGSFDLEKIKAWADSFIVKSTTTETEQKNTRKNTEQTPDYISPDGAMFYKINHPQLGEAYRILKPGGHYWVDKDWDETIWDIHPLKDSKGRIRRYQNENGEDNSAKHVVSKSSQARKACLDLGNQVKLPSIEKYSQLLKYFVSKPQDAKPGLELLGRGLKEFQRLFPEASKVRRFWTSSIDFDPTNQEKIAGKFVWAFDGLFGFTVSNGKRGNYYAVYCIAEEE